MRKETVRSLDEMVVTYVVVLSQRCVDMRGKPRKPDMWVEVETNRPLQLGLPEFEECVATTFIVLSHWLEIVGWTFYTRGHGIWQGISG